jgi:hypothetical protein
MHQEHIAIRDEIRRAEPAVKHILRMAVGTGVIIPSVDENPQLLRQLTLVSGHGYRGTGYYARFLPPRYRELNYEGAAEEAAKLVRSVLSKNHELYRGLHFDTREALEIYIAGLLSNGEPTVQTVDGNGVSVTVFKSIAARAATFPNYCHTDSPKSMWKAADFSVILALDSKKLEGLKQPDYVRGMRVHLALEGEFLSEGIPAQAIKSIWLKGPAGSIKGLSINKMP